MTNSFYREAHGIALFFDLTNKNSFDNISSRFMLDLKNLAKPTAKIILVGTKCDLKDMRTVSKEEAIQFAIENKLPYIETSAKLNINVQESIEYLCASVMSEEYPSLKEHLNFHHHIEWNTENHLKFPIQFKQSVFCFLLSTKRYEKRHKFKIPKVIRIEIIKRTNPKIEIPEILKQIKTISLKKEKENGCRLN